LPLWQQDTNNQKAEMNKGSTAPPQGEFKFSPSVMDDLLEDYAATGVSVDKHPIALLANDPHHKQSLGRYVLANALKHVPAQSVVSVLGLVVGRQSPGTASGVTFVTLEDHTGSINVVVWQATANAQKQAFLTAKILKVTGIIEREGEVIHIIAGRLEDLSDQIPQLSTKSRDFH
jgi:error-prone DNA polymerase